MTTQYGLPARPAEMLAFIKGYMADHGFAPSFQEIADAMGYQSKSSVYRVMEILRERGYVDSIEGASRSLVVLHDDRPKPDRDELGRLRGEVNRLQGELNVSRLESQSLRQMLEAYHV